VLLVTVYLSSGNQVGTSSFPAQVPSPVIPDRTGPTSPQSITHPLSISFLQLDFSFLIESQSPRTVALLPISFSLHNYLPTYTTIQQEIASSVTLLSILRQDSLHSFFASSLGHRSARLSLRFSPKHCISEVEYKLFTSRSPFGQVIFTSRLPMTFCSVAKGPLKVALDIVASIHPFVSFHPTAVFVVTKSNHCAGFSVRLRSSFRGHLWIFRPTVSGRPSLSVPFE